MQKILIIFLFIPFMGFSQQLIYDSIEHDNMQRDYILHLPSSYNHNISMPLVFCFHGYGSNSWSMTYTNFNSIADTAGFIVVYPQGTLLQGITHWNVGGWTLGSNVDDVGFIATLLDSLSVEYNIDLTRVYSTGMSNGGYMSFLLACQLSNKVAAIASVTGSMTPQTYNLCNPEHPTPILQLHGTSDQVVPYLGDPIWTMSINDVLQYWINYNNCNTYPVLTSIPDINPFDGSTVERETWLNGDDFVIVDHLKVIGGDHDWFGVSGNMDIDASLEIWKFFSKYDINGLIVTNTDVDEKSMKKNQLIKIIDVLGRETKQINQPLFYIYDDGTVEKKIIIE